MGRLDELLATPGPPERTTKRQVHPKGWEPGVAWDGEQGTITTEPLEDEPDPAVWRELVADWGLDPERTEIVPGSLQFRGWDANVGDGVIKRLKYYRATLRAKDQTSAADRADVDELCARIMKRKPTKVQSVDAERGLVVALSDWQIGKGEGDGTEGTVDRILAAVDNLGAHLKAMKRRGRQVSTVYLVGMGDLVEQCAGNYSAQAFTTDLDRREQKRVARRLVLAGIDAVLSVERVVLGAVPGNHGENRNGDGKAYTTITDNDDLAVVEEVAEIMAANPERYGHVSTVLADDADLVLDVAGVPVGFRHGHIGGTGQQSTARIEKWWQGQALGRQPVADAQILVSAHFHHFLASEATGRTVLQCPAMDPGSAWWTRSTGASSPCGMLTFGCGDVYGPRGWGDLALL